MTLKNTNRKTQLHFVVSKQEADQIKARMEQAGMINLSAYLRKMALSGYIVHLDLTDIREMTRLLRICSNNLNQYAQRANESGSVYAADIEDIRNRLDELWDVASKILRDLASIS